RTLKRIFRNCGLTSKAASRFSRWRWSKLVRTVGVCPRGAQVRLSGEIRQKPASSINSRIAFRSRHFFFYLWPDPALPPADLLIVPLDRQPLDFLATPTHFLQQTPHSTGSV